MYNCSSPYNNPLQLADDHAVSVNINICASYNHSKCLWGVDMYSHGRVFLARCNQCCIKARLAKDL